jgi:hypothetical protein
VVKACVTERNRPLTGYHRQEHLLAHSLRSLRLCVLARNSSSRKDAEAQSYAKRLVVAACRLQLSGVGNGVSANHTLLHNYRHSSAVDFAIGNALLLPTARRAHPVRGKGSAHLQQNNKGFEPSFSLTYADFRHNHERSFIWMRKNYRLARICINTKS